METTSESKTNLSKIKVLFEKGEKLTVITAYKKVGTFELKHYVCKLRSEGMRITDEWRENNRKRWKVYWLSKPEVIADIVNGA